MLPVLAACPRLTALALLAGLTVAAGAARAQPTFTALAGPACTGTYVYPLPHLSTETDQGSTRFTSAVIIANFNQTITATIQACVYNAGTFLGGTSFTLPINNRVYATDPIATTSPGSGTRPVSLSSLFNVSQLPSNSAFPGVVASNIPLEIEYGFIGPTSRAFSFAHPSAAGTVLGLAHIGNLVGVYPGTIVVSNPNNASVGYALSFLNDDGSVAVQVGNLTIGAFQRQRFDLGGFTDGAGNLVSLRSYYSARIVSSGGTLGAVGFIITPLGDVSINTMTPVSP
jgi:hypothetical protein